MTLRTLVRGSAIYAGGTMLARLGGFVLLPIYLQLMSRSEYGLVALMTSIVGFLGIAYKLGLDGALMRLHFDTPPKQRAGLYRTLLAVTLVFSAAASLLLAGAAGPFFDTIFFGVPFGPYGVLALAIAFVGSGDYVPSILYRSTQQPGRFLAFQLGSFVITSAFSLALVASGLGAAGALLGQLIGGGVMLVVAVVIAARLRGPSGCPSRSHRRCASVCRSSRTRWHSGRCGSGPVAARAPAGAADHTAAGGDRCVLGGLPAWQRRDGRVGFVQCGVAAISLSSRRHRSRTEDLPERHDHHDRRVLLDRARLERIRAVDHRRHREPGYAVATQVLPVVAFGAACQSVYTMFVGVIFLRRRTKRFPFITLVSAVASIALNVLPIPVYGVMGAAVTTLLAYLLSAMLTSQFARRIYPLDLDRWRLALVVVLCVGGALFAARARRRARRGVLARLLHGAIVLGAGLVLLLVLRAPLRALRRDASRVPDEPREAFSVSTGTTAS